MTDRDKKIINVQSGTDHTMNVEHCDDFISIFKNTYPEGYCEHLIAEFDRLASSGAGSYRKELRHVKDDFAITILPGCHTLIPFINKNIVDGFFEILQLAFEEYCEKYSILKDIKVTSTIMKLQRTNPGQGYHIFHTEAGPQVGYEMYQNRAIAYTLYLNTLDKDAGGETEFLYQKRRIPAEGNTLVLWPASYTHAHRGNMVLGNKAKYIVTGWFFYGE